MAKITLKLKKLTDVDVEFVSLVKRGANRLPIKVIKSEDVKHENQEENTMSLLDKLFGNSGIAKDESTEPVISAVIMDKQCDTEAIHTQLQELGFKIDNKEEVEGGVVFKQNDFSEDDVVFRLSETTFIAVKNVKKHFEPFGSGTSFIDNLNKGAFFPSVRMATEVLIDTIVNVMFSTDGKKPPVEDVQKTLDEFSKFVIASLKSIPRDAFKLEDIMVKAEKSASLGNENSAGKTEDEAVDIEKIKSDLSDLLKTDVEKAVAKMEEIKESIKASLVTVKEEIQKETSALKAEIEALKAVSEGFDKRLAKSEEKTDEIEKAVKGNLADGSLDDDSDKAQTAKTEENDPWGGILTCLDEHSAE